MRDTLTRFVLDTAPARGGVVRLDRAFLDAVEAHDYPAHVQSLLGELTAATALLGSSLKWNGAVVLQLQSPGPLKLLCAEASYTLDVRAVANIDGVVQTDLSFAQWMPDARAVLTLDPKGVAENGQMYQGIVAVEPDGIAATIEGYMLQSQQVRTVVILAANASCAAGFFLQKLPGDDAASVEAFNRVEALSRTLSADELLTLDAETLLSRLFHDETVRLLPAQSVRFHCPCSAERVMGALRLIGRVEVDSLLEEHGKIEARCQFCNRAYSFGAADLINLFAVLPDVPGNATHH